MKKVYFLLLVSLLSIHKLYPQESIPAFPSAEGFGAHTIGGRGGKVIKVTNLNDHGPGSLREAIETDGPRIIIFTVGGIINLETELSIKNPYITIAGQKAPGEGICLRGETLRIYTHDVVIRYLRIRPGDIDFGPPNNWEHLDAISIQSNAYNVVIDHCSLSWAVDENIDVWGNAHDITIQNCIISQGLNKSLHPKGYHSMGMIVGSKATNISIHHNILAHNNDRNPHINGQSFVDFRNNVIYNPRGIATDIRANKNQTINYINNVVIKGPSTKIPADLVVRNLKNHVPKLFFQGNKGISQSFKVGFSYEDAWSLPLNSVPALNQAKKGSSSNPFAAPQISTFEATQAYEYALESAGATLPRRDPVDRKVLSDIENRKDDMVSNKNNLLNWPPLDHGVPLLDTDNDGMPDHWEEQYGLDPTFVDNTFDTDGDGYTNIEEYLNDTNPTSTPTSGFAPLSEGNNFKVLKPELNFYLEQNYPNPFEKTTDIKFSVDKPSNVIIQIIDNEGKKVMKLIDNFLYEGKYHITWDSNNINPGVYNIVMSADDHIESIKAILSN